VLVHGHFSRVVVDSGCGITVKCQFAQRNALPVIGSALSSAAACPDTAIGDAVIALIDAAVQAVLAGSVVHRKSRPPTTTTTRVNRKLTSPLN